MKLNFSAYGRLESSTGQVLRLSCSNHTRPNKDTSLQICGHLNPTFNQVAIPDITPCWNQRISLLLCLVVTPLPNWIWHVSTSSCLWMNFPVSWLPWTCTTKGLLCYNRLLFGVSDAPAIIFQHTMDNLIQSMSHICVFFNDLLITGSTHTEHLNYMYQSDVVPRTADAGMQLKKNKCCFMIQQTQYLGNLISCHGLQSMQDKCWGMQEATAPTNIHQLKSFLGLLNFSSKFLPNVATTLASLNLSYRSKTHGTYMYVLVG